jgi:hypothetical protein
LVWTERIWLAVICAALLSLIAVATLLVNPMPSWIDAAVAVRARERGAQASRNNLNRFA